MSKLNNIVDVICKLQSRDISSDAISEALYILKEPVEKQALREYLSMKNAKNKFMQMDAFDNCYKRKNEEEYERLRLRTLQEIEKEEDIFKLIELLLERAKEIKEGIKGIYYNDMFRDCCQIPFMVETCKNMIHAGATLTQIAKYVPGTQMGDIYHLVEDHLGLHIDLTEEEKKEVEKYDCETGEVAIGTTNVWQQLFMQGIPHKKDDMWIMREEEDKEYTTYQIACYYSGCELSYPYYSKGIKNPRYAESFEEVLEKIMIFPQDNSVEGLEKAYSEQEYHLLMALRQKLLEVIVKEESKSN